MRERPNVVWEDHDHAYAWLPTFESLRKRGYKLTVFNYFTPEGLDH